MLAGPGARRLADLYGAAGAFGEISDPVWDAALAQWRRLACVSVADAEARWRYPWRVGG
jgi:hypothetical protein